MELKQIKELMAAMGRAGIKKLNIKKDDFELNLERADHENGRGMIDHGHDMEDFPKMMPANRADQALSRGSELPSRANLGAEPTKEESFIYITSPMVGTFYPSPSPQDPPFVKVGDKVDKNDIVCIIEAMKVMNEIKASVSGTIAEVMLESGQPVEFGTKLFRVVP